jgi:hypothetical protein
LQFAPKIESACPERADGVVRHEIGHVLDFLYEAPRLDAWAAARGVQLPRTPERRADKIAEAVWREPICYDKSIYVQTTQQHGTLKARPKHLGD